VAEDQRHDPAYVVAMLAVASVLGVIVIQLLPVLAAALLQLLWQVVPSVLIVVIIVSVLKGMLKKLVDL